MFISEKYMYLCTLEVICSYSNFCLHTMIHKLYKSFGTEDKVS